MGGQISKMVTNTVSEILSNFIQEAGKHSYGPVSIVALMALYTQAGGANGWAFALAVVMAALMVYGCECAKVPSIILQDGKGRSIQIRGQDAVRHLPRLRLSE